GITRESRVRLCERVVRDFLPVHHRSEFVGKFFLCDVHSFVAVSGQFLYLFEREESEITEHRRHVLVGYVAPVLEEIVRRGLCRLEPDCAFCGFAHFDTLGSGEQTESYGERRLSFLTPDEVRSRENV